MLNGESLARTRCRIMEIDINEFAFEITFKQPVKNDVSNFTLNSINK